MSNKVTYLTKIKLEEKEQGFLITKVLEESLLYFVNNQDDIKKNNRVFGIKPKEGDNANYGVVFTKLDGNCICTCSIKVANKQLLTQFLVRDGLKLERLNELMIEKRLARLITFLPILQQGIELTKIKTLEEMLEIQKMHTEQEKEIKNTEKQKNEN